MKNISDFINEARIQAGPVEIEYTPKDRDELIEAIQDVAKAQSRREVLNFNCIDTRLVQNMDNVFFWALKKMPIQLKKDFLCDQWDVSNVNNFSCTFYKCTGFTGNGLENWNVSSKCKELNGMFDSCKSLKEIDMSKWDLRGVTGMDAMFCNDMELLSVRFPEEMPKLQSAAYVFQFCRALTYVRLPKKILGDVRHTDNMFDMSGSKHNRLIVDNLDSISLPKTDGRSVDEYSRDMFYGCGIMPKILREYINAQNLSDNDIAQLGIDNSRL
jgi:surface protein